MPDSEGKPDPDPQQLDLPSTGTDPSSSIPAIVPPQTTVPFHLYQQVNIQQIPPKVWDKLSAEQIVDLSKRIFDQLEAMDNRQFQAARERVAEESKSRKLALVVGGVVAIAGIGAVSYLATSGNGVVAGIIATFLATILAVIVGSRMAT